MGRTGLKADTKNTWFYIAGALATVQAARFTGIFLECLSASLGIIITTAIEALIFIFFAISIFFYSSQNLKRTWIPAVLVCLHLSANTYGLVDLVKQTFGGNILNTVINSSLLNVLRIILAIFIVALAVVYTLKCFGRFQTRKPVVTMATVVLLLSYALLAATRLTSGTPTINALFVLDLADPAMGIPLCFTALTLSLRR